MPHSLVISGKSHRHVLYIKRNLNFVDKTHDERPSELSSPSKFLRPILERQEECVCLARVLERRQSMA